MTMSPSSRLEISFSARSCRRASMSATTSSTACTPTDRFSQDLRIDPRSFWRSKGSRRLSRLTTCGSTSSMYSYVVYRRWHFRHSRRRRMNSPSRPTRESTTRSSVWPQNGHFIGRPSFGPVGIERKARGQLLHLAPHGGLDGAGAEIGQHAIDQARDLRHLGLLHPAGGDGRRAEADAAGDHGTLRLERNRVLVHGDPGAVERLLRILAGDAARRE